MSERNQKIVIEPPQLTVPNDWQVLPFKKAMHIISDQGKRIKKSEYQDSGSYPVIDQGQEYIGGYTNNQTLAFHDELPVILFGDHTRTIKYVEETFVVGAEGVKILKPADGIEPKFLYYFLRSLNIPSRGYSRHFQFLRKCSFPIAPVDQQKNIVAEIEKQFSRLDEAVTSLKRAKANLKRYKAAVLKAAVEGKLTQEWRKQHPDVEPSSELLKRILAERRRKWEEAEIAKFETNGKYPKDNNWKKKYKEPAKIDKAALEDVPVNWAWATTEQLAEKIVDGTHRTPVYKHEGIDFISAKDIYSSKIDFSRCRKISREEHAELINRCHPTRGNVLVTKSGTIGRVAVVKTDRDFSLFESVALIPLLGNVVPEYISNVVHASVLGDFGRRRQKGVAVRHLHLEDLRVLPVPLPPFDEQVTIVEYYDRLDTVSDMIEMEIDTKLSRSERLRKSILKRAFS